MIANAGSDEMKKYKGGKAGDQTCNEFGVIKWYSRPWSCVLRYPDEKAANEIARIAKAAAMNECIGYDQGERLTFYKKLKEAGWDPSKIRDKCETDCSASTSAIVIAAGYRLGIAELKKVNPSCTTAVMRRSFVCSGFDCLTAKKYLTSDKYLLPGDILLYDGHHVAINLDRGSRVGEPTGSESSLTTVAREVIAGQWGEGSARRAALTAAGWNYAMVQAEVNRLLGK